MARLYAGILGLLALLVSLARGLIHGSAVDSTLWNAWVSLIVFAGFGAVLGALARWIVDDAVRARLEAELVAQRAANPQPKRTPTESPLEPPR